MLKIYSDASLAKDGTAGIACLVVEGDEEFAIDSVIKKVTAKTISEAEAKAVLEATKMAKRYRSQDVVICNDNAPIIDMINGTTTPHITVESIVTEIQKENLKFRAIKRSSNRADALSVFAARRIL